MQSRQYFDGINESISEALPTDIVKLIDKSEQRPYDTSFNPSEGLVRNVYSKTTNLQKYVGTSN